MISLEIYNLGIYSIEKSIIQSLADHIFNVYNEYLKDDVINEEEGYLQLLFDVNFIGDLLHIEKKHLLTQKIIEKIDPINWLIYEKYFEESLIECEKRHSLLFGNNFKKINLSKEEKQDNQNTDPIFSPIIEFPLLSIPVVIEKQKESNIREQENNPIDSFFQSMGRYLKKDEQPSPSSSSKWFNIFTK